MRANIVLSSFGVLLCSLTALPTLADTLKITSEPSGATLEIDGVAVGKTPYEVNLPGGYFHRPRTMFGKRLSAPMRARIVLPGHVTQEIELTRGSLPFVSTKGVYHGDYYVLKSDHFHFDLKKTEDKLTGTAQPAHTGAKVAPELPPDLAPTPAGDPAGSADEAKGRIEIQSTPADAEVYVDGKLVGTTPSAISLRVGPHRIRVITKGFKDWDREVEILKDSEAHLKAILEPL
jgi:hypothetical protein